MNAVAIATVRNDADLVEAFVRHHLALVDLLVLIDNGSCDGTRDILEALRQEGLKLIIVDDPALGADTSAKLTQAMRMVVGVFDPELVYLLDAGDFVRVKDRATLEGELAHLAPGATATMRRQVYLPDIAATAHAALADPLATLAERCAAERSDEQPVVIRRQLGSDHALVVDLAARCVSGADGQPRPLYLLQEAALASFPVRGVAQFTTLIVHAWNVQRARQPGLTGARGRCAWAPWLDQVLSGRELDGESVVQAARRHARSGAALVHDPVSALYGAPRYLHLVRRDAAAAMTSGVHWPHAPAPASTIPTGEAMDLAAAIDLCASLQAQRAIVMAPPQWSESFAQVCPGVVQHVPAPGVADVPVDVLLVPGAPADFGAELCTLASPATIRSIALWPAQARVAGTLAAELQRWHDCGWEPDMMRTLTLRALSTYAAARHAALVLRPIDPASATPAAAVRAALCSLDATPIAWTDPAPSLILHPLQSVGLVTPPAAPAAETAAAVEAAAPAPVVPRSVLIVGAGRSGTSCLAGMFDNDTHRHADNLYAPQVSNPKGFYEAGHINDLNESIMLMSAVAHLGADGTRALMQGFEPHQLWLARFPDKMPAAWNDVHRREIAKAVAATPFVLKDPRMSVTAPAWLEAAPGALLLSIHRPPEVTAESVLKECRVATYLLDFRISQRDALDVWRQAYRRTIRLYRDGQDVVFLRYDDLFDPARLEALEARVRAPLRRQFAERGLDRTQSAVVPDAECRALHALLETLADNTFADKRAADHAAIDRFFAAWPDRSAKPADAARQSQAAFA